MYKILIWKDHYTNMESTYVVRQNSNGTVTLTPAGKVIQQGTSMSAENFNNMECGILDADLANRLLLLLARKNADDIANIKVESESAINVATFENAKQTGSIEAVSLLKLFATNGIGAEVADGGIRIGLNETSFPDSLKHIPKIISLTVTLSPGSWLTDATEGFVYRVEIEGVTADPEKSHVFYSVPSDMDMEKEASRCWVRIHKQGDGFVEFKAMNGIQPTIDITENIMVVIV